ncbi:MAG: DUF4446 family protein [Actinomycetota bacterium]|nr:DUF4446 family protein [Actinomycetota bacterium]
MDQQTLLTFAALSVGFIALITALLAHTSLASQRRSLTLLKGNSDGKTLIDVVSGLAGEVGAFEHKLNMQAKRQEELFALLGTSARNLGVVRYDAFEDMGGRLSFSAALLDDHGNGLVITSINARSESRVYAKSVRAGDSEHNLSIEEQQAIAEALGTKQRVKG